MTFQKLTNHSKKDQCLPNSTFLDNLKPNEEFIAKKLRLICTNLLMVNNKL